MRGESPLWDRQLDGSKAGAISRANLMRRMVHAATLRFWITLASFAVTLFVIPVFFAAMGIDPKKPASAFILFGVPTVVYRICTINICRESVRCPFCGKSLWSCGTGNFKVRRLRIKSDVHACPHCGSPLS
jgi:hypothetical protein